MTMLFRGPSGLTTLRYPIKLVLVGVSAGRSMRFPAPQLGGWGACFHKVVSRRRAGSGVTRPHPLSPSDAAGTPAPQPPEGARPDLPACAGREREEWTVKAEQ